MATQTYYFNARHATEIWTSDPDKMVDGVETQYASTTEDGDIQLLTANNCPGTDLGTISKVELQAYAYSDDNDELGLRPVFAAGDGDTHWEAPGVTAGWKTWWDITSDPNAPTLKQSLTTGDDSSFPAYANYWYAQTFTTAEPYSIAGAKIYGYKQNSPGDVTLSIRATSAGKPSGGDLVSATVLEADLPTGADWIEFSFSTPYPLSGSTQYAIVVRAPAGDAANALLWRFDADNGYADGTKVGSNDSGGSWGTPSATDDFLFQTLGAWSWSNVQSLDCDVEQNDVSKGNTMYCGEVQIRVTYEPTGPPTGQPTLPRTCGIPTGPGYRTGVRGWN